MLTAIRDFKVVHRTFRISADPNDFITAVTLVPHWVATFCTFSHDFTSFLHILAIIYAILILITVRAGIVVHRIRYSLIRQIAYVITHMTANCHVLSLLHHSCVLYRAGQSFIGRHIQSSFLLQCAKIPFPFHCNVGIFQTRNRCRTAHLFWYLRPYHYSCYIFPYRDMLHI